MQDMRGTLSAEGPIYATHKSNLYVLLLRILSGPGCINQDHGWETTGTENRSVGRDCVMLRLEGPVRSQSLELT